MFVPIHRLNLIIKHKLCYKQSTVHFYTQNIFIWWLRTWSPCWPSKARSTLSHLESAMQLNISVVRRNGYIYLPFMNIPGSFPTSDLPIDSFLSLTSFELQWKFYICGHPFFVIPSSLRATEHYYVGRIHVTPLPALSDSDPCEW